MRKSKIIMLELSVDLVETIDVESKSAGVLLNQFYEKIILDGIAGYRKQQNHVAQKQQSKHPILDDSTVNATTEAAYMIAETKRR